MEMIVLNAAQAAAVTGPTAEGHALEPVPLADGATWVLPLAVLSDPAHASRHAELEALPTRDVAAEEFPSAEE